MSEPVTKPRPVALRSAVERYAHVVLRLKERAGIDWTPEQALQLERKIKFVRGRLNLQKPVAPIMPTKIGEEYDGRTHYYRVLIAGAPHTFVWSQVCRGLVSYRGAGELTEPIAPKKNALPPELTRAVDCSPGGDLSRLTRS